MARKATAESQATSAESAPDAGAAAPAPPAAAPAAAERPGHVHMILQGKGGVGKSVAATLLAQYFTDQALNAERPCPPLYLDTDPATQTFLKYNAKGFAVEHIKIAEDDRITINPAKFDELFERIVTQEPRNDVVIDTGSSNFLNLIDYMKQVRIPEILPDQGYQLIIHVVLAGGNVLVDTVQSLDTICQQFAEFHPLDIIIWTNTVNGIVQTDKWQHFKQSATAQGYAEHIRGYIDLPLLPADLQAKDFKKLLDHTDTFALADQLPIYKWAERVRLRHLRNVIWQQIAKGLADITG